ncbi:Dolichyl-phosphate-mannose--protein mannosyltransferase 1, partial [Coemansia sp. RSA 2611]
MASQFHLNPHPPLGKLLITLLFRAFGYTGGSSFDSGEPHPDFVPYVQMRRVQAVLGTLLVPVVFAACRALRLPEMAGIYILADLVDLTIKSQRQTRECLVIWFKHAVLLGVLPLTIYMLAFWQHFARQTNYTPQADHMGSEFNVRLNGSALQVQPPGIYNTSFVVIRANNYPFDYLN